MWPFLGPLVVDPNDLNTEYQSEPFTNPSDFSTHVTSGVLAAIVAKGYDHVRLAVAPGPWMDAVRDGNANRLEYLFELIDVAVTNITGADLGVIIDLHDTYYVRNTPIDLLSAAIDSAIWLRRIEVTRLFATRYASTNPAMVALELFNEPRDSVDITGDWNGRLYSLYVPARTAMPDHTLCLTASGYSSIDNLVAFDPSPYDGNTLWIIHPYLPAIFAIQGYPDNEYNKWTYGLKWPPTPADKASAILAMTTNVNADNSLLAGQKTTLIASQTTDLGYFFDIPQDKRWLNKEYDKVVGWCSAKGIHPSRIWAGETGVTRTNVDYTGTGDTYRIPYLNENLTLIKSRGFRYAVFALDAPDYGITDGVGSNIGIIDPSLNI